MRIDTPSTMTMLGATMDVSGPDPFSREGSRPEDGLGADLRGSEPPAPLPAPIRPPWPAGAQPHPTPPPRPSAPPMGAFPTHPAGPYGPAYGPHPLPGWAMRRTSPYATAALISGILSLFTAITGPVAIGLGIAGLVQVRREPGTYQGSGLAIGGIIVGAFGTLVLLLIVIAIARAAS